MRKEFETSFWQRAYESLPAHVRGRHLHHMQAAERWELALDAAVQAWSRARTAIAKAFQTPSRAH